jgi:hypothetical protein
MQNRTQSQNVEDIVDESGISCDKTIIVKNA